MASNKNALIRYKTIDQCLRNTMRKWTLEDLIEACSDALYEFEGKDVYVSKRTIQLDIQHMRSDKLGYNAPIEVYERKFYHYSEENYSIKNIPVTETDVKVMNEAIAVLRQFKDFSLFKEMDGVLQRLEDSVYASQNTKRAVIHLDKNEHLKGLEYIDPIYHAIRNRIALRVTYQSFKAKEPNDKVIHPQLLKEYNNRWFILALHKNSHITLALDRIINISKESAIEYKDLHIDGDEYYKDVVGATVPNSRPQRIQFWADKQMTPYIITKPFHRSQRLIEQTEDGAIFNIFVKPNFEIERLLLGYAESIEILKPEKLRRQIHYKLSKASKRYEDSVVNEEDH